MRVSDNHCLFHAARKSDEVIPFFCWEPSILGAEDVGSFHLQAQWQALQGLSASLVKRGSGLVEKVGEVVDQLDALVVEDERIVIPFCLHLSRYYHLGLLLHRQLRQMLPIPSHTNGVAGLRP